MHLIDIYSYPVCNVLKSLLQDKTTNKNIIFATDIYTNTELNINEKTEISINILKVLGQEIIQPRIKKSLEHQILRTRKKAEVFTPAWICNKMNNHCDEEWFGRPNVFNTEDGQSWVTTEEPVFFENPEGWKEYVNSKRLEITCGEAPYIVSRYDASTGEPIDIKNRIGILDRKIRVVNENTKTEKEWLMWITRAYESVYGYEFQGDNLLIARINLLVTFVEYMQNRWNRIPTDAELKKITNIIVWNIWQMDGITGTVPFGKPVEEYQQMDFFDFIGGLVTEEKEEAVDCRIYDWRNNKSIMYKSLKEGK